MLELKLVPDTNIIETTVSGKLNNDEINRMSKELKVLFKKYEKVRWLYIMKDFHGWIPKAFFNEILFDIRHTLEFDKIAMVGSEKWEDWMTTFMKPFTTAKVKYFTLEEEPIAREWIVKLIKYEIDMKCYDRPWLQPVFYFL